ncbi:hypothetical protein FB451DRAFT_695214 [Mycena latifolia]|nr:hypothetical protein FB451DRAFT_695214 [Mycena latifolia]
MASQNYVDRVATELWINCWAFCDNQELRRLSLVCRYFLILCQPLLFHSQSVTVPMVEAGNWMMSTRSLHSTAYRLTKLASSPHASSVRTWRWVGNSTLEYILPDRFPKITNIRVLQDTWVRVVNTFTNTLGAYQRLTSLYLSDLRIDIQVRATLASLTRLEELTLRNCEIVARRGDLLAVRKFELLNDFSDEDLVPIEPNELHIIAPDKLQRLSLDGSREGACLLSALITHPLPRLVELAITFSDEGTDQFFAFLDACPVLASLFIRNSVMPSLTTIPEKLPDTTIPMLISFLGPHTVAGLFAYSRPVASIVLWGRVLLEGDEIMTSLRDISQASAPLKYLYIHPLLPPTSLPDLFGLVGALFPDLLKFSVQLRNVARGAVPADDEPEDDDQGENDEEEEEEEEADDRMVDLWEGSISAASSEEDLVIRSDRSSSDDEQHPPTPPPPPAPVVELPGHMYISSGASHPPVFNDLKIHKLPSTLTTVMDLIYTGRIVLPSLLEVLHLHEPGLGSHEKFTLVEEHRAILALERLLPSVKTIGCGYNWVRTRNVWTRVSLGYRNHGSRIISQVWNADGSQS